jgi:plasmid stability protein
MATLTVRNLDDETVKRLRIRAAERGRSAEAEHREILRAALADETAAHRHEIAERLAAFRARNAQSDRPSVTDLLAETRAARMAERGGAG